MKTAAKPSSKRIVIPPLTKQAAAHPEKKPNALTAKVIKEAAEGKNMIRAKSAEELMKSLGVI